MTIPGSNLPVIDQRGREDIAQQVRDHITRYLGYLWPADQNVQQDPKLNAIVNIFSRFMEISLGKVNGSLKKNFLSFLDTLGFTLTAPQSARTAIEFKPVKKTKQNFIVVPNAIQVTGKGTDDNPVFFETESRLTVVTPALCDIRSISPNIDRTLDHTDNFLGQGAHADQKLFTGDDPIPHRIYIGDTRLFSFDKPSDIVLEIHIGDTVKGKIPSSIEWQSTQLVRWYLFTDDAVKKDAKPSVEYEETSADFKNIDNLLEPIIFQPPNDEKSWLAKNLFLPGKYYFTFRNVPLVPSKKVQGYLSENDTLQEEKTPWLVAQLVKPLVDIAFPEIKGINAASPSAIKDYIYLPDSAFFNTVELDCTKDFYPFGERPKTFDTFYISNDHVFEQKESIVMISLTLSNGISAIPSVSAELKWEYFDNQQWKPFEKVAEEKFSNPDDLKQGDLFDGTNSFIGNPGASLEAKFKCPEIGIVNVNGKEHRWIRVRISKGNYGTDAVFEQDGTTSDGNPKWKYTNASYTPPVFGEIHLTYSLLFSPVEKVLSYNNYFFRNVSQAIANSDPNQNKGFIPFIRPDTLEDPSAAPSNSSAIDIEMKDALYLAFDKSIAGLPLSLLFPLVAKESMAWSPNPKPPKLVWEYWNGNDKAWKEIAVADETENLTRPGILQCPIPEEAKPVARFRKQLDWIRVRHIEGDFPLSPTVEGIYLNAVWARHQTTVTKRIWGSSTGMPSQEVTIPSPSLLDECIVSIRETGVTDEQALQIEEESGQGSVENVVVDALGNVTERWTRWQEVDNFYASLPESRHYMIDREKNTLVFGDGKNGMVPPQGRDSIRCDFCRFGGGAAGNVAAGSLTKLRSSIPYIDSANNPIAAEGGMDLETYDMLEARAPQSLRNRDRAVTASDFEALIKRASAKVARVKCLAAMDPLKINKPGWVTALIVPQSDDVRPFPTMELFDAINRYMELRYAANLAETAPSPVNLIAPFYVKVQAKIGAVAASAGDTAYVKQLVDARIRRYFHALRGGVDETGWEFGRHVYRSEVFQALEGIAEVDHVHDVSFPKANVQMLEVVPRTPLNPDRVYPDHSSVSIPTSDGEITMILAEPLQLNGASSGGDGSGTGVSSIRLAGFIEGDEVEIANHHLTMGLEISNVDTDQAVAGKFGLSCGKKDFTQSIGQNIETITLKIATGKNKGLEIPLNLISFDVGTGNECKFLVDFDMYYKDTYNIEPMNGDELKIEYKQPAIVTITDIKRNIKPPNTLTLSFDPMRTEFDFYEKDNQKMEAPSVVANISDTSRRKIRSYVADKVQKDDDGRLKSVIIAEPNQGDSFSITHRDWTSESLTGNIEKTSDVTDIVYLEENYLVYADDPDITIYAPGESIPAADGATGAAPNPAPQEARYLLNTNPSSLEVHDLQKIVPRCNIGEMLDCHKVYVKDLASIQKELDANKYDYCAYCFGKRKSRR